MIRGPPRSTLDRSSAASDVYKRQVYIVVLKGVGVFSGGDNREQRSGPGTLLVFSVGEAHAIRAEDEELVFVTFLHGAPGAQ